MAFVVIQHLDPAHKGAMVELLQPKPGSLSVDRVRENLGTSAASRLFRRRRLAVEHVLDMLAAGDSIEDLLREYPWLERDDVQACLVYAKRLVGHERVEPSIQSPGA